MWRQHNAQCGCSGRKHWEINYYARHQPVTRLILWESVCVCVCVCVHVHVSNYVKWFREKYNESSAKQHSDIKKMRERPCCEPSVCRSPSKWVKGQCKVNESSLEEMSFESELDGKRGGKAPCGVGRRSGGRGNNRNKGSRIGPRLLHWRQNLPVSFAGAE